MSASQAPNVERYIFNQESHHRNRSFRDEFVEMLTINEIAFDERFLWSCSLAVYDGSLVVSRHTRACARAFMLSPATRAGRYHGLVATWATGMHKRGDYQ